MRFMVGRKHWLYSDLRYIQFYLDNVVPTPHTSGYWEHSFDFTNDYFILLAVL